MQKPTHMTATAATGAGLLMINPTFSLFYLLLPLFAILADADHGQDTISRKLSVNLGGKRVGLKIPGKHRGWTHTLYFPILVMMMFYFINLFAPMGLGLWDYAVGAILIFSHSFADMFTVSGIRPLYVPDWIMKTFGELPFVGAILRFFHNIRWRIPIATTGKRSEYRVLFVLLIILALLLGALFASGRLDMFLQGFIDSVSIVGDKFLYVLAGSFAVLFFFLGKELLSLGKNSRKLLSFVIKTLGTVIAVWIGASYFYNMLPESAFKGYAFYLMLIGTLLLLLYLFSKHMERILPVIAYTIIGFLYTALFLVFTKHHAWEIIERETGNYFEQQKVKLIERLKDTTEENMDKLKENVKDGLKDADIQNVIDELNMFQ